MNPNSIFKNKNGAPKAPSDYLWSRPMTVEQSRTLDRLLSEVVSRFGHSAAAYSIACRDAGLEYTKKTELTIIQATDLIIALRKRLGKYI